VKFILGHDVNNRRGLAFFVCPNDDTIDAEAVFNGLTTKKKRDLKSRFDAWLAGKVNDNWYHGWPNNPDYKDCFVFRWKDNRQNHRLYSFLCNPFPNNNNIRLCVLVSHAAKNTWGTDPAELNGAKELSTNVDVNEAIKKAIKEAIKDGQIKLSPETKGSKR